MTTIAGSVNNGDGGRAVNARFSSPGAIAVDVSGNLYVGDGPTSNIRQISAATGNVTAFAFGGTSNAVPGPATSFSFGGVNGIAFDASGNLYASGGGNVVMMVSKATMTVSYVVGSSATRGSIGSTGDGGAATSALLNTPCALALDAVGNLYIADQGNNKVRVVSTAGVINTFAGTGVKGYGGDNATATSAQLNQPQGVAVDVSGNVYIVDTTNNRVRVVRKSTGRIFTFAGGGNVQGDGGAPAAAQLSYPRAVSIDVSGNIYISESSRIRVVSPSIGIITTFAGGRCNNVVTGGEGVAAANAYLCLQGPIAVSATGSTVYAIENLFSGSATRAFNGGRIRAIRKSTGIMTTVGGLVQTSADGTAAASVRMDVSPIAVADVVGNLFFVDALSYRVRVVSKATGRLSTVAGSGVQGTGGDGGSALLAQLYAPSAVVVDVSGNLFIADQIASTYVVRKVSKATTTGTIATVAGGGWLTGATGDGDVATSSVLSTIAVLAVDTTGNLYLATTGTIYFPSVGQLSQVAVRSVDRYSGFIHTVAGNGAVGSVGDGGPATAASFVNVAALAVDVSGNVFVGDGTLHSVRMVSKSTGIISTIPGATGVAFNSVTGLAVDSYGNAYVGVSNAVYMISKSTGLITAIAGSLVGNSGTSGDGGPATSALLWGVGGVSVDGANNVYINDLYRVRVVTGINSYTAAPSAAPSSPSLMPSFASWGMSAAPTHFPAVRRHLCPIHSAAIRVTNACPLCNFIVL